MGGERALWCRHPARPDVAPMSWWTCVIHAPHLLQDQPQRGQCVPRTALDSFLRSPSRSAIWRTDSPWTWRADHLRVLGRELLQRAGNLPAGLRALDGEPWGSCSWRGSWSASAGGRGASAVDDRVRASARRPDAAARRVVGLGVPPGAGEHLLHDFLGGSLVAEGAEREAVQLPRIGAIERAQRLAGGVRRDACEELGVRGHRPLVNTAGPVPGSTPIVACHLDCKPTTVRAQTARRLQAPLRARVELAVEERVGVVATPRARRHGSCALHARGTAPSGGRRRSARRRARAAPRAPTGAGPRAGPGRRTGRRASARTRPAAPPPRPRRRPRGRAGATSARGSGGSTRTAQLAQAQLERRAERALVVAVDDHQPHRPRARGQRGRAEAPGRSRGRSGGARRR